MPESVKTAIDASQALLLADAAAQQEGWGHIGVQDYTAAHFEFKGRPAWAVRYKEIVVGHQFRFLIDAETGEILEKERLGIR